MKRTLGKSHGNSMELLLDTVCNMFGSIVLITLLIVITTTENPLDTILDTSQGPDREEIDRLIHTAELQIADLKREIIKAAANSDMDPKNASTIESLQARIAAARAQIENAREERAEAIKAYSPDTAADLIAIRKEESLLSSQITALKNTISDAERRTPLLQQELDALQTQHKNITTRVASKIRLPKERSTRKRQLYVTLKHNKIYPLFYFTADGNREVHPSNKVDRINSTSTEFSPIPERGISRDETAILREFEHLPPDHYLACSVFPDSVEAFRLLFKTLTAQGVDIGWEPEETGERIVLTTEGGAAPPKPQ